MTAQSGAGGAGQGSAQAVLDDPPPATQPPTQRNRGLAWPKRHSLFERYRYPAILLVRLVRTEFKLRYHGSALGYLWSLLKPLFLFLIMYLVFAKFLKLGAGI